MKTMQVIGHYGRTIGLATALSIAALANSGCNNKAQNNAVKNNTEEILYRKEMDKLYSYNVIAFDAENNGEALLAYDDNDIDPGKRCCRSDPTKQIDTNLLKQLDSVYNRTDSIWNKHCNDITMAYYFNGSWAPVYDNYANMTGGRNLLDDGKTIFTLEHEPDEARDLYEKYVINSLFDRTVEAYNDAQNSQDAVEKYDSLYNAYQQAYDIYLKSFNFNDNRMTYDQKKEAQKVMLEFSDIYNNTGRNLKLDADSLAEANGVGYIEIDYHTRNKYAMLFKTKVLDYDKRQWDKANKEFWEIASNYPIQDYSEKLLEAHMKFEHVAKIFRQDRLMYEKLIEDGSLQRSMISRSILKDLNERYQQKTGKNLDEDSKTLWHWLQYVYFW